MDKKFKDFAVPFIFTVSAVFAGLVLYDWYKMRKAKKEMEKAKATV